MPTTPIVLGIDVGTSGTKAVAVDPSGEVLARSLTTHPSSVPKPGWSEQAPEDWVTGTMRAIAKVLKHPAVDPGSVEAIGLTGQMHGLVTLDATGSIVRPAILWNDQRSAPQCLEVEGDLGPEFMLRHTGNRILPGFTAPKLLWMREHEPDEMARIRHVILPKDYVRFRLGSELATDVSDASGTSVFDCGKRTWSVPMLDALGLQQSWWPEAAESSEIVDGLAPDVARALGLRTGIPLIAGAGDQAASAVGSGIVEEGIVSATLGTSGVVFASSDTWRTTPEGSLHAYCHAVPGTWHLMGVMLSAAGSFEWFGRSVAPDVMARAEARDDDPWEELCGLASEIEPGSNGLYFLPYLTGERTPHADPEARGCFIGLSPEHDRRHMTRSVIEGVTYGMRDCLDLVRAAGVDPDVIRLSGGGARAPLWRALCADVFGCRTTTTTTTEATAFGAAILAGVGVRVWADVPTACGLLVRERERAEPGDSSLTYQRLHRRYHDLYPALRRWWSGS